MMISFLRKRVPVPVLAIYHFLLAQAAAFLYGYPSERLMVIGVTGTNGKSSTVQFIGRMLEHAGFRVGWTSTVGFKVANQEWMNEKKMTMLGRFQTQKLLREMVRAGCTHAVIETSSQGIEQFRHVGINYDIAVFTNLTPEHIEAHGGFENYKHAKGKLFAALARGKRKTFGDTTYEKTSVVNVNDPHAEFFFSFPVDRRYGFGVKSEVPSLASSFIPLLADDVECTSQGSVFTVEDRVFELKPLGRFNVLNALAAIATLRALRVDWQTLRDTVSQLEPVPGRMEAIHENQPFSVVVDYAYEPAALQACYDTIKLFGYKRLIHVLGSAGGGRDVARRSILGAMAGKRADVVVVTNEDPYDDDPMMIVDGVANGAAKAGKEDGKTLFRILDRAEAIRKAMSLAEANDLVLVTGKGSEPVMAVAGGKKVPWDDRLEARKALHALPRV